jgi:hypothetical protein
MLEMPGRSFRLGTCPMSPPPLKWPAGQAGSNGSPILKLLDATLADEQTAQHTPDPALLSRGSSPRGAAPKPQFAEARPDARGVLQPLGVRPDQAPSGRPQVANPPPPSARRVREATIPVDTLRLVVARYTSDAGPAARVLTLRALQEMGCGLDQVPATRRRELIARLAAHLDQPDTRVAFEHDAAFILGGM